MTRVYFMCGPAGSGKSTYARTLEAQGWVRLSFDVEATARGISSMPLPAEVHAEIEQFLLGMFHAALESGHDVVFDYSFWSLTMREKYRKIVRATGNEPEVIYIKTDRATALASVAERTGNGSDAFELSPELAAQYFDNFQPPTPGEGPLTVVVR